MKSLKTKNNGNVSRRDFIKQASLAAGGLLAAGKGALDTMAQAKPEAPTIAGKRPNVLFICTDQQNIDAISASGLPWLHTPNLDRLTQRGVTFSESHSTNPVCSPGRSSLFTGRMTTETGVVTNDRYIHESVPNMGQWLRQGGYDTYYCGKWHLPDGYPAEIEGFEVIPVGGGQGDLVDVVVSRQCEAFLHNRTSQTPFLFVASLMQPHDICYWAIKNKAVVPVVPRYEDLAGPLPDLPANHASRPVAPKYADQGAYAGFNEYQWRYYRYIYYRQVEMVDYEVGRILDALEDSGQADNTIVIFTSDHGEGCGHHKHVQKWHPYDESVKVPLLISCPGQVLESVTDDHLVSGIDLMSTICDYAGIAQPQYCQGESLRPILEGRALQKREFVVSEVQVCGRVLRTEDYKYVNFKGDPIEQLFDMKADPGETNNLYAEAKYADILTDHRKLLDDWEASLNPLPEPTPCWYANAPWIQERIDAWYGPGKS